MTNSKKVLGEKEESLGMEIVAEARDYRGILRGVLMKCPEKDNQWFICSFKNNRYKMAHIGPYPTAKAAMFSLEIISGCSLSESEQSGHEQQDGVEVRRARMDCEREVEFEIYNVGKRTRVAHHEFKIYAHVLGSKMYIGYSNDPVQRWQDHVGDAFNSNCPNYDSRFKRAIRAHAGSVRHLILAVANDEGLAMRKEAEAIRFYKPSLNTGATVSSDIKKFGYKCLKSQCPRIVILEKKPRSSASRARDDDERLPAIAEIYIGRNRKRLRSIENEYFEAGLHIECARSDREMFEVGDLVSVDVAVSYKPSGTKYLVAKKESLLKKIGTRA